jgi:hypothetical protein
MNEPEDDAFDMRRRPVAKRKETETPRTLLPSPNKKLAAFMLAEQENLRLQEQPPLPPLQKTSQSLLAPWSVRRF